MTKIASKEFSSIKNLILFTFVVMIVPATSSNPGSSLQSLSLGTQDRAVTIRMRLKNIAPRTKVFITGNVRSLGEWQQPIQVQAVHQDEWQVKFAASRLELGLMNTVIFKVQTHTKILSVLFSIDKRIQILATTNGDSNILVAMAEEEIDSISIVRHTAATPIAVQSDREAERKLVEYARRLNTGRELCEESRQRMTEMRERWLRRKILAGLYDSIFWDHVVVMYESASLESLDGLIRI
jgi:hypothetical protein